MEHVKQLPEVNLAFADALAKGIVEERTLRAQWARHHAHEMSYDEFHMRRGLATEGGEGRMIPARARECLKTYNNR